MRTLTRLLTVLLLACWPGLASAQILRGPMTLSSANASCLSTNCVQQSLPNVESFSVGVQGTFTGTLEFEATNDNGSTWSALGLIDTADFGRDTEATGTGIWLGVNNGYTAIRVRVSALSSGSASVTITRGQGGVIAPLSSGSVSVASDGSTGSSVPGTANYQGINVSGTLRGATGLSLGSHFAPALAIVDASGNQITAFGGGTQYAVDTALGSTPTGTLALAIRDDALSALTPIEGDAVGLRVDSTGALWVIPSGGSMAVTQSGTWNLTNISGTISLPTGAATESTLSGLLTNQQSVLTTLQVIDNLVLAESATHSSGESGVMVLGVRNDAGTALATDGQRIPLSVDSSGAVRVTGGGGGTQYTEGDTDASITGTAVLWEDGSNTLATVTAGNPLPVTCATCSGTGVQHIDDAAFNDETDDIVPLGAMFADTGVDSVNEDDAGVLRMSANRVLYVMIRDAAGNERGLNIDASGQLAVTASNLSTNLAQVGGTTTVTAGVSGMLAVGGNIAHDSAVTSNPLLMGGYASAAAPTSVSGDGDAVRAWFIRNGSLATTITAAGALIGGDASNGLDVDVTRVQGTVTVDTELAAAGALADNTANPTVSGLAAYLMCFDGSTWDRCLSAATTELTHDGAITPGSTVALSTMFRASSTEPTNVSTNDDAVLPWALPSGALLTSVRDSQGDDATDTTNDAIRVNIVAGAAAGGTSMTDDAAFTVATTSFTPIGGTYKSTRDTLDDNDAGALALNQRRGVFASLETPNSDSVADETLDTIKVSQATAANLNATVVGTGTFAVQVSSLPASTNTIEVVGDAAHDATVAGNPLLMGASSSAAAPTDVSADGEAVRLWALRNGALAIQPTFSGTLAAVNNGAVSAGTLRVTIANDSTGVLATVSTVSTVTSLSQFAGNAINLGSGTIGTGTLRITVATDDPVNDALVNLDSALNADEGAFTYATTQVLAIGAVAESTTDTLADGTLGAPVMTLARSLRTTPTGYATGGAVPVTMKSDNTNNDDETAICTGPCTVYSITAFNHAAAAAFLRCENDTAANTTPGSETAADGEPDFEIPGNATGAGFTVHFPVGISYATALTCWIATGEAATDATDAATDDVTVLISRVQ